MGGGGKGSTTQTTSQNQQYTANPAIQQSAYNALGMANSAASQPFQMPQAPVAGFSPLQQQAFNQYQSLQGTAQPYYNTAQNLYSQSAAPVSASDVSNYYNPMASNVTAQMENIFGQQNAQNTANLVQSAGGIGADRIAVGQGTLANQQGLAAGQTYSNLYQQALQAAQGQKQMEAGAASGMSGLGTAAQNAALQGTSALFGAGNAQQQQSQSELNAPYQQKLAQLAYPFQTAQYLAGITGGLAPALGGTTIGNGDQTTTPPQPSALSQILGVGTAGAGLYNSMNTSGKGGEAYGGNGVYGGSSSSPLPGLSASDYGAGFASGGEVDDEATGPEQSNSVVPNINLTPGAGHSGPLTGALNMQMPQAKQGGSGDSIGSDIASVAKTAASIIPFLRAGGKVRGYDDGGDIPYSYGGWGQGPYPTAPPPSTEGFGINDVGSIFPHMKVDNAPPQYSPEEMGENPIVNKLSKNFEDFSAAASPSQYGPPPPPTPPSAPPASSPDPGIPPPSSGGFMDRLLGNKAAAAPAPAPPPAGALTKQPGIPFPGVSGQMPLPTPQAPPPRPMPHISRPSGGGGGGGATPQAGAPASTGESPPYPDALDRDWGQNAARSPWMALVQAGATMASTPGPLGVAIGKGLLAGTKSVDDQRKELRSEQELNDKAKELYQKAKEHLDKYNQMTPYERASVAARNRELDQSEATPTGKPTKFSGADYDRAARFVQSMSPGLPPEQLQPLIDAEVSRRRRALGAAATGGGAAPSPGTIQNAKAALASGAKIDDVIAKARQNGVVLTPDMLQ